MFSLNLLSPIFTRLDYERFEAARYWPLGKDKAVVIDPRHSFGQAIDSETSVPTKALYGMYKGGESVEIIGSWYNVKRQSVLDAIDFERSLLSKVRMIYIFDENLSHQLAKLLTRLGQDVCHILDRFPPKPSGDGWKDGEFLPEIGNSGDILVTFDRAMMRPTGKHGHGAILQAYNVKVVFLPRSFQTNPA